MTLRFSCDTGEYGGLQFGVAGATTQHLAQRHLVFLPEAQVEIAIDTQAHTVAGIAEML